ncbi:MAG: hypothetical protein J5910_02630 [Lachnospiraceae bacterium]|nr:hypothetical protein [Lachnospiraceae bacterium]
MNIARAGQLQITGPDRKPSYGGDQRWFSSNTKAAGGCGSVAGANVLRSLAMVNTQFRDQIISSSTIPVAVKDALCSKNPGHDSFSLLMTGIYETMGSFEVFPLNRIYDRMDRSSKAFTRIKSTFGLSNVGFIIGIIRFARKFSLDLAVKSCPTAFMSKEEAGAFIREGLASSGAVVMLTCRNRHNARLFDPGCDLKDRLIDGKDATIKGHYTTITDMDGDRLLITTWGKPGVVDLNELAGSWQSIRAYESCLMYIYPCTRKEATSCMLGSWKLFVAGIKHAITRS